MGVLVGRTDLGSDDTCNALAEDTAWLAVGETRAGNPGIPCVEAERVQAVINNMSSSSTL